MTNTTNIPAAPKPSDFLRELRRLHGIDGSKTERQMFRDFCAMAYYAAAKRMCLARGDENLADEREDAYMQIVGTYRNKDVVRGYPKLMAIAMLGVDVGEDFLGSVAAELNVLDHRNGQYFTPMSVCMMMAQISMGAGEATQIVKDSGYIRIGEPCAGSGAMVIATKRVIEREGLDPLQHMLVHAVELNRLSYWMCYLQLTWAGIPALVEHGDSLRMETFEREFTLPTLEFTKYHDTLFETVSPDELRQERATFDVELPKTRQLSLFKWAKD